MAVADQAQGRAVSPPVMFTGAMVGLLALAVFINYLDRGNLATAAPRIKDELKLSNTEIGILVSAFFWVYAPAQIFAAYMIQRINAYRTLAIGVALWSLATLLTGFAGGFAQLLALRTLLGLGESAAYPASSKLFAQHLPPEKLGVANSLISVGQLMGPAAGTLAGGLLLAHAGWRVLFIAFGALSLLWVIPWVLSTRAISAHARTEARTVEPSFAELFSKPQLWGASLAHFCSNYSLYMVISWLPLYLVKVHGFSLTAMGALGAATYVLGAVAAVTAGWLADRWIRRGMAPSMARIGMMITSNLLVAMCMVACGLGDARWAIAGLICSQAATGIGGFNLFAIGQSLAGPRGAGKWIGIQNAIGNTSGIVGPVVTGWIVDVTGHFTLAFLAAGALALVGALMWRFVVRDVEPVAWRGD
jgi:MFS family permease